MTAVLDRRTLLAGVLAAVACGREREEGEGRASFWYSYGGKNREALERLLRRYAVVEPRGRIAATFQGDYFEALAKVRTALAAGAAPALTHVVGEVVPYLAAAGVLEPLEGYEGAGDLALLPGLDQAGSFRGVGERPLYAVPFNRSTPIMYANRNMLHQRGLALPADWSGLRKAAQALTRRRGSEVAVWGLGCPVASWFWAAMVFSCGAELTNAAGEFTLGDEAGVRALALWQEMVHSDRTMRPPLGRDYNAWQVGMQDFLAERTAMLWSSSAFLRYVEENATFPVDVAALPGESRSAVPTGGTFFVILRAAAPAAKRAAWRFVRWMTASEQTAEWSRSTGYLPVGRAAVRQLEASGYYEAHPGDRMALEQLAHVQPWPWSPALFRVQREVMDPLLEQAVLDARDPEQVMAAARAEARDT